MTHAHVLPSETEKLLRVVEEDLLACGGVGHPRRDEVEETYRVHAVGVRKERVVAAPDDAIRRRLDQRTRDRHRVFVERRGAEAVRRSQLDPALALALAQQLGK